MTSFVLQLNPKTARRLAHAIGMSDQANTIVQANLTAAREAENNVRDVVSLIADQTQVILPPYYSIQFDDEINEVTITSTDPPEMPTQLRVNGKQE